MCTALTFSRNIIRCPSTPRSKGLIRFARQSILEPCDRNNKIRGIDSNEQALQIEYSAESVAERERKNYVCLVSSSKGERLEDRGS